MQTITGLTATFILIYIIRSIIPDVDDDSKVENYMSKIVPNSKAAELHTKQLEANTDAE